MSAAKRRKKSAGARLRPFWIVLLLAALAVGSGAYYAATWPGFYPKSVTVSGNRVVSAGEILQHAAIAPHENVWLQNARAAAVRIEAIPYVKSAQIHRSPPASVRITVSERTPFAVLQYGARRAVIDADLRVLQTAPLASPLPLIVGRAAVMPRAGAFLRDTDVEHLRDDYQALGQAHVAVRALRYDKFGDLIATTRGGISLLLGDDTDLAKKAALVDPIISQVSATGRKLAAVDLRAPKTPVVVYKQ